MKNRTFVGVGEDGRVGVEGEVLGDDPRRELEDLGVRLERARQPSRTPGSAANTAPSEQGDDDAGLAWPARLLRLVVMDMSVPRFLVPDVEEGQDHRQQENDDGAAEASENS